MNKILIFGASQTADLAFFYITKHSNLQVAAFVVTKDRLNNDKYIPNGSLTEYPLVALEVVENIFSISEHLFFAPITGIRMNGFRKEIYEIAKKKGYLFYSYISPYATVLTDEIGENCFILEDNTIQPFTKIGNNVVLWSGNHIGHHSIIEDNVFITSQVVVSGNCIIGDSSWIGVNATLSNDIRIGYKSLVAMGALLTNDTESDSVYMGVPAKKQPKKSNEYFI